MFVAAVGFRDLHSQNYTENHDICTVNVVYYYIHQYGGSFQVFKHNIYMYTYM